MVLSEPRASTLFHVISRVVTLRHNLQIFRSVICWITVDVMDDFIVCERPSEHGSYDEAISKRVRSAEKFRLWIAWAVNKDTTIDARYCAALPVWVLRPGITASWFSSCPRHAIPRRAIWWWYTVAQAWKTLKSRQSA